MVFRIFQVLIFVLIADSASGVECIAHRGFSTEFPENTLEAILAAWGVGADVVEVDVHLLQDRELVLFHDPEIAGFDLSDLTYPSLQSLVPGYHVPTLIEALSEIPADKAILIDLKSVSNASLEVLIEVIERESPKCRIQIQSMSLSVLSQLASRMPESISFYWVSKLKRSGILRRPPDAQALANLLVEARIDGITAKGRNFVTREFVEAFRSRGLRYYVWTINNPARIRHYVSLGVDGVITDQPNVFRDALGPPENE